MKEITNFNFPWCGVDKGSPIADAEEIFNVLRNSTGEITTVRLTDYNSKHGHFYTTTSQLKHICSDHSEELKALGRKKIIAVCANPSEAPELIFEA
jgi:hypothetical protein